MPNLLPNPGPNPGINFKNQLDEIQLLIERSHYSSAISACFKLIEIGLNELHNRLWNFLFETERSKLWIEMHEAFRTYNNADFNYNYATLGSMILFAKCTAFWDHVKEMSEGNLRFIRRVNWDQIRDLRNKITHKHVIMHRVDALEMLFWTKIFLYESNLIAGPTEPVPMLLETSCTPCSYTISLNWNFCPNCGENTKQKCNKCNRTINKSHKICPSCDHTLIENLSGHHIEKEYKNYVEAIWADYMVTPLERKYLNQKRLELGISMEKAEIIETEVIPEKLFLFLELIDATLVDGKIDKLEKEFLMGKAKIFEIPEEAANDLINNKKRKSTIKNPALKRENKIKMSASYLDGSKLNIPKHISSQLDKEIKILFLKLDGFDNKVEAKIQRGADGKGQFRLTNFGIDYKNWLSGFKLDDVILVEVMDPKTLWFRAHMKKN